MNPSTFSGAVAPQEVQVGGGGAGGPANGWGTMHNGLRFIALSFVLLVAAGLASADPVLPGPDALGLYFDAEAGSIDLSLLAPGTYPVYLILTRPSMDFVSGWQASFTITGNAQVELCELPVDGQPTSSGPADFAASFGTPVPGTVLTKLAVFTVRSSAQENAQFFLGAVAAPAVSGDLPCVQVSGGSWQQVAVASGDPDLPVATVSAQTATRGSSWGQVKGLFR